MKKIAIYTTQNVTIEYELASLRERILAYVLDILLLGVSLSALIFFIDDSFSGDTENILYFLIILPIYAFYTLCFEIFNHGQTLGKMALRIRVIKLNGKQPENFDYFIRWVFRIVDITFTLGTLAMILISSTEKAQRLGGFVSGTAVIKLDPEMQLSLKQILKINSIEQHQPKFPAIRQLNESDMLVLKMTLDRYVKYKNTAHSEMLEKALEVVYRETGLKPEDGNEVNFLKTLIQDYIVLTR